MITTNELADQVCAVIPSHDSEHCQIKILPLAVSSLAASKTCGLAMLVDKLLNKEANAATKQLVNMLINRIHHNAVVISATLEENPEHFIADMIQTAAIFAEERSHSRTAVDTSARLLINTVENYGVNQNFSTLEYNWKEFAFHFYRSRLNSL